jgi:hypothetical protein
MPCRQVPTHSLKERERPMLLSLYNIPVLCPLGVYIRANINCLHLLSAHADAISKNLSANANTDNGFRVCNRIHIRFIYNMYFVCLKYVILNKFTKTLAFGVNTKITSFYIKYRLIMFRLVWLAMSLSCVTLLQA